MSALSALSALPTPGRVGYVFLEAIQRLDWAVTTSVSGQACRKGSQSRKFIASITELAIYD